ncbi:RNA polymerase sigma factor [Alteribacillus iranensis]|uniref:DNA-directed RNA polymerase specialized sigma subunit, sigma24 family n=1 Tax=Alteribacillus iranensis TaxID=930128 RepID=A0A1I2C0F8_9BACI|nr:sigma factor-like helix-turn-helix DNA-binding protein [Alteribacillus iranensis]SFE61672.1 DNA-directed RNA polymerase specialized sigma subunit, sigma24 family [Alteribacillus iranensis]
MADHTLIERTRFGDDTAFQELIHKYNRDIQLFLLQAGVPVETTAAVLKETFYQANRSVASFEGTSVSAWLYRLARDTAFAWKAGSPSDKGETETDPVVKEKATKAYEQLNILPEKYRIPFILSHFHKKTYEEITEILSTDEETAKNAVEEAWRQLTLRISESPDIDVSVEEFLKRTEENYRKLPSLISGDTIWSYLKKKKKQRKTKISWLIGIGGTLSVLSLGIFLLLSQSVLLPEESDPQGTATSPDPEEDMDQDQRKEDFAQDKAIAAERDEQKDISFLIEGMEETQTFQLLTAPPLSFSTYIPEHFTVESGEEGKTEVFAAFTPEQEPTSEAVWTFQEYEGTTVRDEIIEDMKQKYGDQGYELYEERNEENLEYGAYGLFFRSEDGAGSSVVFMENEENMVTWETNHPPEMADGLAARQQVAADEWEWIEQ